MTASTKRSLVEQVTMTTAIGVDAGYAHLGTRNGRVRGVWECGFCDATGEVNDAPVLADVTQLSLAIGELLQHLDACPEAGGA